MEKYAVQNASYMPSITHAEGYAYVVCGAGTEQEYKDSKVSDWFDNGSIVVPSEDGYDVIIRFDASFDIDTLFLQQGFAFDEDRIHVHRV